MRHKHLEPDILQGSLWKNISLFAIPVAITSILEQLSNLIDTVMIGHFSPDGGALGMAAVGSNSPITGLLVNLFVGISLGANVAIAHAVGAGDEREASRRTHTSVALCVVGIGIALVMELASRPLLQCLDVPAEAFEDALAFLRVYLLGVPAVLLYNLEAAVFRSVGETRMPLLALALSAVLNVVLDAVFVPFFGWGAAGVALATVLCYCASSAFLFVRLLSAEKPIGIAPARLGIDAASARTILGIGLPAGVQGAVFAVANILIQSCINSLGTQVMAASSAALALEYICYSVLTSFSQACTTFVGQNNGARQAGRCRKTLGVCLAEDGAVSVALVLLVLVFGRGLLTLFSSDPDVIQAAYVRLCTVFPAYAFSMVYENVAGYLRGFGISLAPSVATVLGVCGIRALWVVAVFPASPTFSTVLLAYPTSLGVTAVLMLAMLFVCRPSRGLAVGAGEENA